MSSRYAFLPGQSHLIFGIGSTGHVTTTWISKLCCADALYKPLENLDAIALAFLLSLTALALRGLPGELIQSVAQRFDAAQSAMRFGIHPALKEYRRDSSQSLQTAGILLSLAIIADFCQQSGSQAFVLITMRMNTLTWVDDHAMTEVEIEEFYGLILACWKEGLFTPNEDFPFTLDEMLADWQGELPDLNQYKRKTMW